MTSWQWSPPTPSTPCSSSLGAVAWPQAQLRTLDTLDPSDSLPSTLVTFVTTASFLALPPHCARSRRSLMNIDARRAGPPSFGRQPAIYQPNPKELQHCPRTRRLAIVPHGARSRLAKGQSTPFFKGAKGQSTPFFKGAKTTGDSPGRMRRRDPSGECTKLGLRPSNPPRHGTNVTMMYRAAHGRFEHFAASPHGRLREARGQDGQKGQVRKGHA